MKGWFVYYYPIQGYYCVGPFGSEEAAKRHAREHPKDFERIFYGKLFEVAK